MLTLERHKRICEIIEDRKSVTVPELAEFLKVSISTIRRDLEKLEQEGLLLRTRGGAVSTKNVNYALLYDVREERNREEKIRIGKAAAALVGDEETIIIDAGTTTTQIARNIGDKENLVVVTNSLKIASELEGKKGVTVILTGGTLKPDTHSLVGPLAQETLRKIHASKAFLGAGGLSVEYGITYFDLLEIELRKVMLEVADEIIVVADHSKFGKVATASAAAIKSVNKVITDRDVSPEQIKVFEDRGIKVLLA